MSNKTIVLLLSLLISSLIQPLQTLACQASFTISGPATGTYTYSFTNTSTGNYSAAQWYFGDGSFSNGPANVTHTYASPGVYGVCLTVWDSVNGCQSSFCDTLVIAPSGGCSAYFSANALGNGSFYFSNQSVGTNNSYFWSFGDGTSSSNINPNHTYSASGVYNVCLILNSSNGCTDTFCMSVLAQTGSGGNNCDASFTFADSGGVFFFLPNTTSSTYTYLWTFGDGTSSTQPYPVHIYNSPGPWAVCLTVVDSSQNCNDSWCDSVWAQSGSGCQAYFSSVVDTNNNAYFTNLSSGNPLQFAWSFGDGSSGSGPNPVHTYANPGTYTVCLTIFGPNCQDSYCDSIVIGPASNCVPQFYSFPDSTFGSGVINFVMINSCPGWSYVWNFGDSSSVTGAGPLTHQYNATGTYYVCVTAFDNFGNVLTWCDSVSALRIGGSTGLGEAGNAIPVSVFPNPAQELLQVQFELHQGCDAALEVYTMHGQLMYRENNFYPTGTTRLNLDAGSWESGLYFLRILGTGGQSVIRFTVQR